MALSASAVLAQEEPAGESHTASTVAGHQGETESGGNIEGKENTSSNEGVLGTNTDAHGTTEGGHETSTAQPDNPILPTGPELAWGAGTFILLWALMKFVLLKPIVKTMQERSARISGDLESAETAKSQAVGAVADYEASLANARVEASQIIDDARAEADGQRRQILAAAEAEVTELRTAANTEVAAAKAEALQSLRSSVATIAVQAAEAVVQKRLDAAAQRAIVDDYLNRASQN